jgi:hypothetical protein
VSNYWTRWRAEFEKALDPRLYTIEFLDALVGSGRAQVWFGDDAGMVTEIRTYPTGARVIHGLLAAGHLDEITDILIPRAEAWARSLGCVLAIIESRSGWARQLRKRGYEPHQLAVRKELAAL